MINCLSVKTKDGFLQLTQEQEAQIRDQIRIMDAQDLLSCWGGDEAFELEEISDDELLELGMRLEDIYYNDNGDAEFQLLQEMGYIK